MRQTKRDGEILLDQKCTEDPDIACAIKREGIPRKGVGEPCCCILHPLNVCAAWENEKDEGREGRFDTPRIPCRNTLRMLNRRHHLCVLAPLLLSIFLMSAEATQKDEKGEYGGKNVKMRERREQWCAWLGKEGGLQCNNLNNSCSV